MKPLRPIPQQAYESFRAYLLKNRWKHYLFHCIYCLTIHGLGLDGNYKYYTPKTFMKKF